MMHGWRGRLLRVNLSTGKISTDPLDPQVAKDYIGGRGWSNDGIPSPEKLAELGID